MENPRPRTRPDDLLFRVGTGAFALVLILIVVGIGAELFRQSHLSIRKFGWQFWQTDDVGSRRRRVRRPSVHLGHALLLGSGADHLDANRARDRDLHLGDLPQSGCGGRWCS